MNSINRCLFITGQGVSFFPKGVSFFPATVSFLPGKKDLKKDLKKVGSRGRPFEGPTVPTLFLKN